MELPETPARRRFAALIARDEVPLVEAALAIAEEEYPDLTEPAYLARLDELAAAARRKLPEKRTAADALRAVREVLFEEAGFRGNEADYYDPRNSYLNEVLDRRLGIPISLSVVFLAVARRVGLDVAGVPFPGHFLVKHRAAGRELFIDPYRGGELLTAADCAERYEALTHGKGVFDPRFLEAASTAQILGRMLHNLKKIYAERGDDLRTLWTIDRLLLLFPGNLAERRDRGLVSARLGGRDAALCDLQAYLDASPDAADAVEVRELARTLRQSHTFLN
ncbi:MAG: transglutaminase family protein [Deltaproteobacteria bacterium]|nr:transglutaminase family protein [Deltaproteobacteria bacterium]